MPQRDEIKNYSAHRREIGAQSLGCCVTPSETPVCERLMMSHHPSTQLRTGLASSDDFHYSRCLRCLTFLLFGTEFVDKLQAYIRSFLCTINNLTLRSFAIATALEARIGRM